jgi:mono/diheme cytochrome c family protein
MVAAAWAGELNSGSELYHQYCAVCHGAEGKGNGPVADILKKKPADLTRLAADNRGKFPELRVMNSIRGDETLVSHGSRQMPVWGRVFLDRTGHREVVQIRIYALLRYIEQLQVSTAQATGSITADMDPRERSRRGSGP